MVVDLPLWKIWVRQMGWLFPIWKNKTCSKPPTSCDHLCIFCFGHGSVFRKKIFTKRNSSVRLRLWVCPSAFSPGIFRFRPGRRLTITSGPSNSKDYAWPWSNSYSNKISKNHWVFHLYKGCNMLQLNMQNSEWERNWPKMTRFIPVSGRCNLWAKVKLMDSIWGSTWRKILESFKLPETPPPSQNVQSKERWMLVAGP